MAEADMQSANLFIGSDTALPIQSHDISVLSHPQNHSWKRHFQHFGLITLPKDTLTCSSGGIRISNHQPMDNWMTHSTSWSTVAPKWCCTILHDCILNWLTLHGTIQRGTKQLLGLPEEGGTARRDYFKNIQNNSSWFYFKLHQKEKLLSNRISHLYWQIPSSINACQLRFIYELHLQSPSEYLVWP